jgi:hypothetical protein
VRVLEAVQARLANILLGWTTTVAYNFIYMSIEKVSVKIGGYRSETK